MAKAKAKRKKSRSGAHSLDKALSGLGLTAAEKRRVKKAAQSACKVKHAKRKASKKRSTRRKTRR